MRRQNCAYKYTYIHHMKVIIRALGGYQSRFYQYMSPPSLSESWEQVREKGGDGPRSNLSGLLGLLPVRKLQ